MAKLTKNILTREEIQKELYSHYNADTHSTLVFLGASALVCFPIAALFLFIALSSLENVPLEIFLSLMIVAVITAPVWLLLWAFLIGLKVRKWIQKGEFDITTRELLRKEERFVTGRNHSRTVRVFHFADFGEQEVENTIFELSESGDVFYIVLYRTSNAVAKIYSTKMYEYKEP